MRDHVSVLTVWSRALLLLALGVVLGSLLAAVPLATAAEPKGVEGAESRTAYATVQSAGPLDRLFLGIDGATQIAHVTDGEVYEVYPPHTVPGDYGTFVLLGDTLYSADYGAHGGTATGNLGTYVDMVPVSQGVVQGTGTPSDPYRLTTVFDVGTTGLQIEQTDKYVVGQESYRTDVKVKNLGSNYRSIILYRAMDCFLGGSDFGYGMQIGTMVGCTVNPNNTPPDRVEQLVPLSTGNNYYEAFYGEVWQAIGDHAAFDNTCRCNENIDNGIGISWNVSIPPAQEVTRSHLTVFSPTGVVALMMDKTADSAVSMPGETNGYTITIQNPNPQDVNLNWIVDTLPQGFAYQTGTTTGLTTNNPTVAGRELTWYGPLAIPGAGTAQLHFNVTVGTVAGVFSYCNSVRADAGNITVGGVTETACISVDPNCYLQFLSSGYVADESGVKFDVTVRRVGNISPTASVEYATSDGTAKAGEDYFEATGTLTWGADDASDRFFSVYMIDDTFTEGSEIFYVTLSNPVGTDVYLGSPSVAVVAINDDEFREFRVNTQFLDSQTRPSVGVSSSGSSVVLWDSFGQDGSNWGVFGQRLDAVGNPVGGEFQVNTYTTAAQRDISVGMNGAGSFVASWESTGEDGNSNGVFAQRYDASGNPQGGEFQVNQYTTGSQENPALAVDPSGNFLVVWQSANQDGSQTGVVGRAYNASGAPYGNEFLVNTFTTGSQQAPEVAASGAGFVVAWESYGEESAGFGVIGRRFTSQGAAQGSEFVVNSYTTANQSNPDVARAADGSFLIVWQGDNQQDGNGTGVFAQYFDASGVKLGSEFRVNTYTTNNQENPAVGMRGDGTAMVVWESVEQDGSGRGTFGQALDTNRAFLGIEFQANAYIVDSQYVPDAAWSDAGNYVITWASTNQERNGDEVYAVVNAQIIRSSLIFEDGFESGTTAAWSFAVP